MRVFFFKELDTDLLRDDLRADKVFFGKTKSHLFQDEFDLLGKEKTARDDHSLVRPIVSDLFAFLHRSIRLDLQLLKDVGGLGDLAILFFYLG